MHHPTDRIAHTTAFVTPVMEHWLEREIAQWVHPMKDRSNNPSHLPATGAVMRQTSGWPDLPSTLLRNEAYVAAPVTLPTWAGFLRTVLQWNAFPGRHGTRTPHLHLHHMHVGEAESTPLAISIICAD